VPRRLRILIDGLPLHIVQRGHNREPCFFTEEDYHCYLRWLGEALVETGCALHAYALMTNHVHLLLTPSVAAQVPALLVSLGRRYVPGVNRRYRRTGTLWDSRYKSSLIEVDAYLLACQRYIELNPVRAGIVSDPALYRWTSYRANALGHHDVMLTAHSVYLALGTSAGERQSAYRAIFREEVDAELLDDIRLALNQNQPLGNQRFRATIESVTGTKCQPRPRGRPLGHAR
jgi:putative transposase